MSILENLIKLARSEELQADIDETVNDPFPPIWQIAPSGFSEPQSFAVALRYALGGNRLFLDLTSAVRAAEEGGKSI